MGLLFCPARREDLAKWRERIENYDSTEGRYVSRVP